MAVPARHVRPAPARRPPAPRRGARPSSAGRVPARPARRRRWVPFLVVSAVMVGSMVMGLVSMQALVAQRSFDVQDLEQRAGELATDYTYLRRELAELSNPGRIEAAARKAGLVLQEQVEVLEVPPSAVPGPDRAVAAAGGTAALKAALGAEG
ncbi:MAG: hypothetical protein ACRDI0_08010 [Actinomycetota bacterium]